MTFLVGIDGGGTSCRARARALDGRLIGEGRSGTANLAAGVAVARKNILSAIELALAEAGHGPGALSRCHVGMGLAAADDTALVDALLADLPFAEAVVETDSISACRGAFGGEDGGVAICGTGTAYVTRVGGVFHKIGGWGFKLADHGSAADIGRSALRATLFAVDGIRPRSGLTETLLDHFGGDPDAIVTFAETALPRDFGQFSPLIFDRAEAGDAVAAAIVAQAVEDIGECLDAMVDKGTARLCLLGGLAVRYRVLIAERFRRLLVEPEADAVEGALMLARARLETRAVS